MNIPPLAPSFFVVFILRSGEPFLRALGAGSFLAFGLGSLLGELDFSLDFIDFLDSLETREKVLGYDVSLSRWHVMLLYFEFLSG